MLWWKNWLRGVCFFPLHSLITRHSNTYGSGIIMRRMPRILRPLNNDVSFLFRLERESNMRLEGGRVRKERKPSIIIIESSCICIFRNFNDAKQTFSFRLHVMARRQCRNVNSHGDFIFNINNNTAMVQKIIKAPVFYIIKTVSTTKRPRNGQHKMNFSIVIVTSPSIH